jgi:hypothetical protein
VALQHAPNDLRLVFQWARILDERNFCPRLSHGVEDSCPAPSHELPSRFWLEIGLVGQLFVEFIAVSEIFDLCIK